MKNSLPYTWADIENSLDSLQEVEGGYSNARRGIISLPENTQVFVKIGVDDNTRKWASKEVETYQILASHGYRHTPSLMAANSDNTGFAIEALPANQGWDWTDTWTEARLTATLEAMDALASLPLNATEQKYFATSTINETQDGWKQLAASAEAQQILINKLQLAKRHDIADVLQIADAAAQSAPFVFSQSTLVHNDVRADNCAWNAKTNEVKLVDWNWAQLGDSRIDTGSFLVHVHKTGLDVAEHHAGHLDVDALHWLAGFWLNAATQPLWPGASEKSALRDHQLSSGIAALDLIQTLARR